ncbi:MAG: hypothetical protein JRI25_01815 [Deltaproteobacteria bacterium]|nr:hypothetical protein [Deltaproteobacteria bacterium]MBW2253317.1 hypothetical protein [Deltaproteobacteria bacterium]
MRWFPALLLLAVPCAAEAITSPQQGIYAATGGGVVLDTAAPVAVGPAWDLSIGWWTGRYDGVYALGRFTGLGITVRQDWERGALRTAPALEVRRGTDVLVVAYHTFLSVGPVFTSGAVGVEGLLGVGVKYRFQPHLGVGLRLGAGAAWVEDVRARVTADLVIEFAAPLKRTD